MSRQPQRQVRASFIASSHLVDGLSARDSRRPLLCGVALLGAGIALVLNLR